ncbi:CoA transferase [Streptomyces sp. NPDC001276]|uniref:CoA transferase n=1 Tax=Streptomyces sp. NPDC001276 TaxID=3364555 RepID=UPI00367C464E
MTGLGETRPLAHTAGHDITYIPITGALAPIGRPNGPPQVPLNLLGDFAGGSLYLVVGPLAALHEAARPVATRSSTPRPWTARAIATMIYGMKGAGAWQPQRDTNLLDTWVPFYNGYETSHGGTWRSARSRRSSTPSSSGFSALTPTPGSFA